MNTLETLQLCCPNIRVRVSLLSTGKVSENDAASRTSLGGIFRVEMPDVEMLGRFFAGLRGGAAGGERREGLSVVIVRGERGVVKYSREDMTVEVDEEG